jgi:hypothetical protein
MQAIMTKYHGPGNVRGARLSAMSEDGIRVYVDYPDQLNGPTCHWQAAAALCRKLGWSGRYIAGATPGGWVFVPAEGDVFHAPELEDAGGGK